jgi:hypothetical protein
MGKKDKKDSTDIADEILNDFNFPKDDAKKDDLLKNLNQAENVYNMVRAKDVFKPYVKYMIVAGGGSFVIAFLAGFIFTPQGQYFSIPFALNDQSSASSSTESLPNTLFADKFEFSLILGTSAAAAAAIVFAALGSSAVQTQNERLSAFSHKIDSIRDRIALEELGETKGDSTSGIP